MSNSTEHLTLTDFLLARIAEDEEAARAVNRGRWNSRVAMLDPDLYWHVARQHPARVLAECAAKRAIVENAESERQRMAIYNRAHLAGDLTTPGDLRARLDANVRWGTLYDVLRAMAGVYRDHPDCDASWEVWP